MGFSKKDAYNYIEKTKREKIVDGDANVTIIYLEGKAVSDPMCMARYNLTDINMLANLFWADDGSRVDYQHFGDMLSFDSTYKKNKYRRPLVIFSGSNNHKQTTIFGFGLVLDESIGSYTWLLENLLEVMCNKKPSVIVTNGCDLMRAAINAVFLEATHRLCAWHVEKNVTSNVKDEGLRQHFTRWLYSNMEIEEFEAEWDASVVEYRLHDKSHLKSIHSNPVITTCLDPLERFAAAVYTRELFLDVKRVIDGVGAVNFVRKVRRSTTVVYTLKTTAFQHEHAREIPSRLVLKRWHKDAKSLDNYGEGRADECSERGFLLRQDTLHSASQWFSFIAAQGPGLFNTAMSGIRALCEQIEVAYDQKVPSAEGRDTPSVKDPMVVKTKGAPRITKMNGRKRRYSMCQKAGHTKRHCTEKRGVNMQANPQVDEKAAEFGSEGSSPTENAKMMHDIIRVIERLASNPRQV
ncbi:putative protein FAR1-RELATED SEQUENCE 10 [Arachis duranensis]|uniref:MULE transposase domain-containing protein n=1 Tax=Arachis duranensis TaxID=130453 RepID=A0A6P5MH88_ARADU|nr:putative protein FAR1-RELATED SEQUENCE 10 [Arachis duranensis]